MHALRRSGVWIGGLVAVLVAIVAVAIGRAVRPGPADVRISADPRPNIVLVVWDTARWDHTQPGGYGANTTPNLQRLASDAVTYTNARSPSPWTLPAHVSLFTGRLPGEHGTTWRWFDAAVRPGPVPLDAVAGSRDWLAPRLADAGYTTVGVTSNPWVSDKTGLDAGFHQFGALWQDTPPRWAVTAGLRASGRAPRTWERFSTLAAELPGGVVDTPFFAFLNFIDPHQPYSAPDPSAFGGDSEDWAALSARNGGRSLEKLLLSGELTLPEGRLDGLYDAELHFVDAQLGVLMDWLKSEGVYDDTLLVVTADHGEHLGEGGRWSHQLSMEDALLRVPLVVKHPGGRSAGTTVDRPVSTRAIYRTVLEAAGVEGLDASAGPDLDRQAPVISEYYWSDAYLSDLQGQTDAFDPAPHRAVRRVIAQGPYQVELRGDELVRAVRVDGQEADGPDDQAQLDALISTLRRYGAAHTVPRRGIEATNDGANDEVELLKTLGYVGDGTD